VLITSGNNYNLAFLGYSNEPVKRGGLIGNKFTITVRGLTEQDIDHARQNLKFKNLESEIEINATNANITLENITGPAVVYLSSGNIKADFSQLNQKYPVLFTTMNGEIDINLPSSTKANLKIANLSNSQTFTDFDFDFEDDNKAYREGFLGNMIKCKINGGGVEMQLRATNGDVFIRKK